MNADLVIRNGTVVDGTGGPAARQDVAIVADRVAAVGDLSGVEAPVIDASGLVVAPGFIDSHTHDDLALLGGPEGMAAKLSQGVTTVVAGNCGFSAAPCLPPGKAQAPLLPEGPAWRFETFGQYVDALRGSRPAVNAALLVGHTHLRLNACADPSRPASPAESAAVARMVEEAFDAGAVGLSSGVYYPDAAGANPDELAPLLGVVSRRGGIYTTHIRDESDQVMPALDEALTAARRAEVPLVLSHHKVTHRRNRGLTVRTLEYVEAAREKQPVGLDVYPYTAGSTVLLPYEPDYEDIRILVTRTAAPIGRYRSRYLHTIARKMGLPLAEAIEALSPAGAIYFTMAEEDVLRVLAYPHAMVGSDGLPWDPHPHPRLWGTFPRVLGRYVRERGLIGLEEAVRRTTSLPAQTYGLRGRGMIAPGAWADLCLFDPATISDRATYGRPIQASAGIACVVVNGQVAWRDGRLTGARAGQVLART